MNAAQPEVPPDTAETKNAYQDINLYVRVRRLDTAADPAEAGDTRLYMKVGQEHFTRNTDGSFTQGETSFHDLVMFRRAREDELLRRRRSSTAARTASATGGQPSRFRGLAGLG